MNENTVLIVFTGYKPTDVTIKIATQEWYDYNIKYLEEKDYDLGKINRENKKLHEEIYNLPDAQNKVIRFIEY